MFVRPTGTLGDNWAAVEAANNADTQYVPTFETIAPGIIDYANQVRVAGETIIDAVARVRLNLAMTDAQRELLQIQIDRARAGLPPIQTSQYGVGGGQLQVQGLTLQNPLVLLALVAIVVMLLRKR